MKYLSKNYRPAEKEYFKLSEEFQKAVKLDEAAGRPIHPDVFDFIKTLIKLTETIENHVGNRIKKEERKQTAEAEKRANAKSECPRCEEIVPVTVITEIKIPKTGFTHYIVKCKVCKKEFTDSIPFSDEEAIKWHENLIKQMHRIEPDGRPLWQCASIPEQEIIGLSQKLEEYKKSVEDEQNAFRKQDEAQARIDKMVEKSRDDMLVLRLKLQNWNAGDVKA